MCLKLSSLPFLKGSTSQGSLKKMEAPSPSPHGSATPALPKHSDLSSEQLSFLDQHFRTPKDLPHKAPLLLSALGRNCSDLDRDLLHLQTSLTKSCVSWISHSFEAKTAAHRLNLDLQNLSLLASQHGIGSKRLHKVLLKELPQLAEKVLRIEAIRSYFGTTLKLEALVGDLEDAVFCFMNCQTSIMFSAKLSKSSLSTEFGTKHEKLLQAIKAMNDIEDKLVDLVVLQPRWHHLLKSVDARVDKNFAILRPQVSADHRSLLISLGWPPKLSISKVEGGHISDLPNPLVIMQGEKVKTYSSSFINLCALQNFQMRREKRQSNILEQEKCIIRLWAIDELVLPIASRMEHHFSQWVDQPEFMFALAYKITIDFIAGIDDVLQPLIDRARLVSCSAKEAWVSAMVQTLSRFLETRVFSSLADQYKDKQIKGEVIPSWLHLIDLILTFNKQMQSLVSLEICHFLTESDRLQVLSRGISLLTIFCDRPEWLKIWAKIEIKNAYKKLKVELQDDKSWSVDSKHQAGLHSEAECEHYLLSTREDHKAPLIAESSLKIAWEMIERCQAMPAVLPRIQFIRSTAVRFLWYFFKVLLLRYKGTEIDSENLDDDALSRRCLLINAARYIEFRLQQWSDSVDFLEMKVAENDCKNRRNVNHSCFFEEEIKSLCELETNWLMDIIAVILRQFENLSWDYVKQAKHLQQESEGGYLQVSVAANLAVSVDFVDALDTLRSHLHALKMTLNPKDFLDLWRSLAEGLDHFIFFSNIFAEIQFYANRVNQFETDIQALFSVFKSFCVRPEAFFPSIRGGLNLLKANKERGKR
ncbi:RINT1-like protein MAG2L [Humulus lupulus]|uniref:RINT1-like protein MAG2L n=1 Tax=Humulus lupulus TaxID=3486 RepID=UPI002B4066E0|nr:RINT1-like protein MAG2L [Humulus lupulus]